MPSTITNTGTRIRHLPGRGDPEPFTLAPGESRQVPDGWVQEFAVGRDKNHKNVEKDKAVAAMVARGDLTLSPIVEGEEKEPAPAPAPAPTPRSHRSRG